MLIFFISCIKAPAVLAVLAKLVRSSGFLNTYCIAAFFVFEKGFAKLPIVLPAFFQAALATAAFLSLLIPAKVFVKDTVPLPIDLTKAGMFLNMPVKPPIAAPGIAPTPPSIKPTAPPIKAPSRAPSSNIPAL